MHLLFGHDAEVAQWVASQIPHMNGEGFGPVAAIGILDEQGVPAAGCVYAGHQPQYGNIYLSIAAVNPYWCTRKTLSALLRYPFTQLGVQRVTAITPADERTSIWRFLTRFGWKQEGRIRKGLGNQDAVIWGLLASEWRTHRFNEDRAVERKGRRRRRRRGTLSLESHAVH